MPLIYTKNANQGVQAGVAVLDREVFPEFDDIGNWSATDDNADSLVASLNHVLGTASIQFAKADGTGILASGTLTLTGNAVDTETVVIDAKTYTFQDTLTDVDGNVHIGATASDTLDNLIDAINLGAGAGTDYATSMTLHPTVSAVAADGDTMTATAKTAPGNSIATTETLSAGSWGGATLSGGSGDFAIVENTSINVNVSRFTAKALLELSIFLDDITDVAYAFVRLGTNATNYNEWRIDDTALTADINDFHSVALHTCENAVTGNGWDPAVVTYIAVGIAFDLEGDTLAGIRFDHVQITQAA